MVCIEPANVLKNQLLLSPGAIHSLIVSINVKNYTQTSNAGGLP
jgi:D-hexose-6-phosphate mutarotase